MSEQVEDYVLNFLSRKETPEDIQKLKEWLAGSPSRRDELKHLLAAWDVACMKDVCHEAAFQRFMNRVNDNDSINESNSESDSDSDRKGDMDDRKGRPYKIREYSAFTIISRIAAIFVVSFLLGMLSHFYFAKSPPEQVAFIEKIVPLGSKSEIKLPDGSTVSLNAGSTMRYPTDYGKNKRDIYLEGEGYFIVSKLAEKPFTVRTTLSNITAIGTEFNVKAYPDENVVETTLIKGEVVVENSETISPFEPNILKEGEKLTVIATEFQPELIITQLETHIADAIVSWKESNWYIESETLNELAVKLERRYNVRINMDETLKSYRFTGTIKDETLEQILSYMKITAPILFNFEGKNVNIQVDAERIKTAY